MKGTLKIAVANDMMSAIGFVEQIGESKITEAYIEEQLKDMGIVSGIRKEAIEQLLIEKIYGKEYLLTEGKPAIHGLDGYYEWFFESEKKEYRPQILENGIVDYSVKREVVQKGDLLAKYHPAKKGTYGYTIFAGIISPIVARELPPLKTYGVERKENSYFATTNGEAQFKNNVLAVMDMLYIEGDASNATGNIQYPGDIYITGDVITGVTIKSKGTVLVEGVVEGATIETEKDIIIKRGIHGKGKALIQTKGSLITGFISETEVHVGEDIICNTINNSVLEAKKEINAKGINGSIQGGTVVAGKAIRTTFAGNSSELHTSLKIQDFGAGLETDSRIVVSKKHFEGTELQFGHIKYYGLSTHGEYHLVNGVVERYEIGFYDRYAKLKYTVQNGTTKILVVDDEPIMLKTFFKYLSQDYEVYAANSAKDAFAIMEKTVPDLILLDYNMPEMNGAEMLEKMRQLTQKPYCNVPVIFVTAFANREVVIECFSSHPQGYLIKPITKEKLLEAVRQIFCKRNKERIQPVDALVVRRR